MADISEQTLVTPVQNQPQLPVGKIIMVDDEPDLGAVRSNVEEIKKAGDGASALTRQLLAFSRTQILQPKVLDLNEVIADLEKVKRLIGEDIDLLTIPDPVLGKVKADPGQIETGLTKSDC